MLRLPMPLRVFFDTVDDNQQTGLDSLNDNAVSSPCYYNLQGQRIAQPATNGLFLERNGRKIVFRK